MNVSLRTKEFLTFSAVASLTGVAVIALTFLVLNVVEGGESSPLAFALMILMTAVFGLFFAIIPSALTAAIISNQSKTPLKYLLRCIAVGFTVTMLCALAYCMVDGVELLGSWAAIGSLEFWVQYTPHLGVAALTGILSPLVGSLTVVRVYPQLFKSKTYV